VRLLAIETSTQQASVALIGDGGAVIASRRDRVTTHSERLLPLLRELLAEAGVALSAVDGIACGAGPGSFTGLRIGLATAKGLCLGAGLPLLLVSSLEALAWRAPAGAVAVACIDAFKCEVYAGVFARGAGGELSAIEPEAVLPPERLADRLRARLAAGGPPLHLIGDGAERWPALHLAGLVRTDRQPPDAVAVGQIALARLRRGERDALGSAAPTYIRPSEAEMMSGAKPA